MLSSYLDIFLMISALDEIASRIIESVMSGVGFLMRMAQFA